MPLAILYIHYISSCEPTNALKEMGHREVTSDYTSPSWVRTLFPYDLVGFGARDCKVSTPLLPNHSRQLANAIWPVLWARFGDVGRVSAVEDAVAPCDYLPQTFVVQNMNESAVESSVVARRMKVTEFIRCIWVEFFVSSHSSPKR